MRRHAPPPRGCRRHAPEDVDADPLATLGAVAAGAFAGALQISMIDTMIDTPRQGG